jgi:murein DD-endopeptidase MepM/ murein hydrolase activator NlpD
MQRGSVYGDVGRQRGQAAQIKRFGVIHNLLIWLSVIVAAGAMTPAEAEATSQKAVSKGPSKAKAAVPTPPFRRLTYNTLLPAREATPLDLLDRGQHVVYRIRSKDNLSQILNRFNLTASEKQLWERSIRQHFRPGTLEPARQVHFYFSKPAISGKRGEGLSAVEVDFNDAMDLTWEKSGRNIFFARREKPFDVELKTVTATIDESLFASGMKAGIHASLLSQLADIFTWDVDLEKDIYQGDSFKILYEQRSRRGQSTKTQLRILAAELINAGQKMTAIYFEKQKGLGGYYNLEGRSLARSFLRFPLEFTSITSKFTESRFHPVLKTSVPHTGVDFAAERGTPVRAVGDGTISQAGWNGSYGKLVEIQHESSYTTRYAHLDGYGEGIQAGSVVKKGQVIGFVGSTGRSTGPHLHFELYKDQQYVNPLGLEFPAEDTIEPALLKLFENQKNTFLVELTSLPQS